MVVCWDAACSEEASDGCSDCSTICNCSAGGQANRVITITESRPQASKKSEHLLFAVPFAAVLEHYSSLTPDNKPPFRSLCANFLLTTSPIAFMLVRVLRTFSTARVVVLLRVPQTFLTLTDTLYWYTIPVYMTPLRGAINRGSSKLATCR